MEWWTTHETLGPADRDIKRKTALSNFFKYNEELMGAYENVLQKRCTAEKCSSGP